MYTLFMNTEQLSDFLASRREIILAYVFGSLVHGTANQYSDIDIAVLIDKYEAEKSNPRYGYKAGLLTDLIGLLQTNHVDLVILNDAPYLLRHRVVTTGKRIYARDQKTHIDFETRAIDTYCDFKNSLAAAKHR